MKVMGLTAVGALVVLAGAFSSPVLAANSQQTKMSSCNAEAKTKGLSGADRKSFMKTCLSAQPAAADAGNSQQTRMKTCNADAKTKSLKGADRRKFMSDCLKGPAAPASP